MIVPGGSNKCELSQGIVQQKNSWDAHERWRK
jgi:hypothetical protein